MRNVVIGAGTTKLNEPSFNMGCSVRVRVLVEENEAVPRIYVSAMRQEQPVYLRDINSRGEKDVVLSGLGAGSFEVRAYGNKDRSEVIRRIIELDGVNDIHLELDMR